MCPKPRAEKNILPDCEMDPVVRYLWMHRHVMLNLPIDEDLRERYEVFRQLLHYPIPDNTISTASFRRFIEMHQEQGLFPEHVQPIEQEQAAPNPNETTMTNGEQETENEKSNEHEQAAPNPNETSMTDGGEQETENDKPNEQ